MPQIHVTSTPLPNEKITIN